MTLQQLERKVEELELQIAELRRELKPLKPFANIESTFGLFADDPGFDDVIQLGREFRERANAGEEPC